MNFRWLFWVCENDHPSQTITCSGICSDEPRHVLGCGAVWPRGLGFLYQRFSSLRGDEAGLFRNQQSRTSVILATIVVSGTRGP